MISGTTGTKRSVENAIEASNAKQAKSSHMAETTSLAMHDIEAAFYNKSKMPPLFFAVSIGNLALLKKLLQMGQLLDCAYTEPDSSSVTTVLQLAARNNNLPILTVLLENGADPKINAEHVTVLNYAIVTLDINADIVATLIKYRPYLLKYANSQRKFPVDLAADCGNVDKIKVVVEENSRVGALDPSLMNVVEEAFNNKFTMPPLFLAVLNGNLRLVKQLLLMGQSPNCAFADYDAAFESTALQLAARMNNLPILTALLESGAHHSIKTYHATVLNYAIEPFAINAATVATLIKYRPELLNIPTQQGKYPVHVAASSRNLEKIKIIVEEGGNVDALSLVENFSPVWLAAASGNADVTRYLVEQQADLTWCSHQKNIVEVAREKSGKHSVLSKFLKSKMNFPKIILDKIKEQFVQICDYHLDKAQEAGKKFLLMFGEHHGVYKTSRLYKALIPLLINKGINTIYTELADQTVRRLLDASCLDDVIRLSRKLSINLYGVDNQRYDSTGGLASIETRNAGIANAIQQHNQSGIFITGAAHMEGLLAESDQKIDTSQFYIVPVNLDRFPTVHRSFERGFWIEPTNVIQLKEEGFSEAKEVVKRWNPT